MWPGLCKRDSSHKVAGPRKQLGFGAATYPSNVIHRTNLKGDEPLSRARGTTTHAIALSPSAAVTKKRAPLDHDPQRRCLLELLDRAAARGADVPTLATRALTRKITKRLAPLADRKKKVANAETESGWRRTLIFETEEDAAGANADRLENPVLPPPIPDLLTDYKSLE